MSAANKATSIGSGDFSLVLGGPLYQLWRRTHLSGDALQLAVVTLLPVIPLMLTMMSVEELAMRLVKIVF